MSNTTAPPADLVPTESRLSKRSRLRKNIYRHRWYYVMLLPGVLYFIIYHYLPMGGAMIAQVILFPFRAATKFGRAWKG